MNKQSGVIAAGYIWLVGGIIVLVLLGALVRTTTGYLDGVRTEAKKAGEDACDAAYKARDNAQLRTAMDRVKELEEQARAAEAGHVAALAAIGEQLKQEKADGKARQAKFDADVASGKLVVRASAFETRSSPAISGGSAPGAAGTGTSGSDAGASCQLSGEARSNLLAIGDDADDTARTLAACQAVVLEDRRLCGAAPGSGAPAPK